MAATWRPGPVSPVPASGGLDPALNTGRRRYRRPLPHPKRNAWPRFSRRENRLGAILICCISLLGCAPTYLTLGYASEADYAFSQQFAHATPHVVAELKEHGIGSRQELDAVVAEMDADHYSSDNANYATIFEYHSDKRVAAAKGISPATQRRQRLAEQEAAAQRQAEQLAREFPYKLVITCEIQGQNIGIEPCFLRSRHGIDTVLEIRNGTDYGMFKPWDLRRLGDSRGEGLIIPLRENFSVKGQNASERFLLTFKLFSTATGDRLFIESAPRYGFLAIANGRAGP